MRRLWISLAMLALVLGLTLYHIDGVKKTTGHIAQQLNRAEQAAQSGAWEEARNLTQNAMDEWDRVDTWFAIMLRTGDTDEVTVGFQEVLGFLAYEESAEYSSANAALTEKVRHLYETEQLNWNNLL